MQASAAERRPAAKAALQSIVHLCRWACEPLQGRYPTMQMAEEQEARVLELLCKVGGGEGSGSSSVTGGSRHSLTRLCAIAVAAAGYPQLQRSAAALADLPIAAAVRQGTLGNAWQLAAVTPLLLCMCGCSGQSSSDAHAHGSGSGGCKASGSFPVTVACLHSRPGQRLLKTRVDTPATLLAVVFMLADEGRNTLLSTLLKIEVHGRTCGAVTKRYRDYVVWLRIAPVQAEVAAFIYHAAARGEARQRQGGCQLAPRIASAHALQAGHAATSGAHPQL